MEDKLIIKTAFARHILSKLATKKLQESTGYQIDGVILDDLVATMDENQAVVRISGEIRLPANEVNRIITKFGM